MMIMGTMVDNIIHYYCHANIKLHVILCEQLNVVVTGLIYIGNEIIYRKLQEQRCAQVLRSGGYINEF